MNSQTQVNPQFQFQGTGRINEGNMIFLQMNRVNQAFSRTLDSTSSDAMRTYAFAVEQCIRTLEDCVDSFLDEEFKEKKKELIKKYDAATEEGNMKDRLRYLHRYYKLLENLLHRQSLWFKTGKYYEVMAVDE